MPELDAETLMQDTNAGLARLLQETEKKAKLEVERINLERERVSRQQEILEKEQHHNEQLDRLVQIIDELNGLLKMTVKTSLDQLHDKIRSIYSVQETLLLFLIKEYEKIKDASSREVLDTLKETLGTISNNLKSDNNFTVTGNVQSSRDVNLSSNVNTENNNQNCN